MQSYKKPDFVRFLFFRTFVGSIALPRSGNSSVKLAQLASLAYFPLRIPTSCRLLMRMRAVA